MTTWFYVKEWSADLEAVEIERFTAHSVWIKGSKRARSTENGGYLETRAEAVQWLIDVWTRKEAAAARRLDACRRTLSEALALKTVNAPETEKP